MQRRMLERFIQFAPFWLALLATSTVLSGTSKKITLVVGGEGEAPAEPARQSPCQSPTLSTVSVARGSAGASPSRTTTAQVLLRFNSAEEATSLRRLTTDGDIKQHLAWSPDGKQLLFTRIHKGQMGLWLMNADGSNVRPLLDKEKMPTFDGHWSPDGQRIAFVYDVLQGTDGKLHIHTVGADGANNKLLVPYKAFEESPRWSPDGKQVLFVSTRDGNQELYLADAEGKNIKRLTSEAAADNNPAWSPDGRHLAFCSARAGNLEIYRLKADGGDLRRLTHHPSIDCWPAWSPDGKWIAFTSNRDRNYELYLMNADGGGERNLTNHPAQDHYAAWSPDSRQLAFVSNRTGGYDIYVMELK